MKHAFNILYEVIYMEQKVSLEPWLMDRVLKLATLNKVSLQFLRIMDLEGKCKAKEEEEFTKIIKKCEEISQELRDLDYVFYKFIKPIAYVPADIDILINHKCVYSAVSRLKQMGFKLKVVEPYCITMNSCEIILDLYIHPNLGGMIYLDGEELLKHRTVMKFQGIEIPTLKYYAEALVVAAHAIYKECLYTLNDYMTIKKWMGQRTIRLSEKLKCKSVIKQAIKLNQAVDDGRLELPYRIPIPMWISLLTQKILKDPLARSTSTNLPKVLISSRGLMQMLSKLTRKTY
ncbi:MAG: hypothetical protein QXS19_05075 [Candidatus Methanomethylicia archaeon]